MAPKTSFADKVERQFSQDRICTGLKKPGRQSLTYSPSSNHSASGILGSPALIAQARLPEADGEGHG